MGYDSKYGKVTTAFGDIPDDEPVVVFRAKDQLLPLLMANYHDMCEQAGSPQRHLDLIKVTYERIHAWQAENSTEVPGSERSRAWMGDGVGPA